LNVEVRMSFTNSQTSTSRNKIAYPVRRGMNLNTFGPVGKLEGVMCLLIVARCWCYCANQLKIHTHKVYSKEGLVLAAVYSRSFSQPPSV
jgi:hypothetical protein